MRRRHRMGIAVVVALGWGSVLCMAAGSRAPRALTLDDLFRLEEIGDVALAPDGQTVAYVRRRPLTAAAAYQQSELVHNDRADIWITPVAGGASTNLTNGDSDGSGSWLPTWSPDGTRLAMLSTKGGQNIHLWVWEKSTGRLTQQSDRVVSNQFRLPFVWLDRERLAVIVSPEDEQSRAMSIQARTTMAAAREWAKSRAGHEATASVLESGVPADLKTRPSEELLLLDAKSNARSLASAPAIRDLQVSPDHLHVTFLKQVAVIRPNPQTHLPHGGSRLNGKRGWGTENRYQLALATPGGREDIVEPKDVRFVEPGSIHWSRDGHAVAFIGVRDREENGPFRVFRSSVDGRTAAVPLMDLDPISLVWVADDSLLVSARRPASGGSEAEQRLDWWLVRPGRPAENVTTRLKAVPDALLSDPPGRMFVGVADGDVWRLDVVSRAWTNLTVALDQKVSAIAWPGAETPTSPLVPRPMPHHAGFSRVVVSAQTDAIVDYYGVDMSSGRVARLDRPSHFARLVTYRPDSDLALFVASEPNGTFLTGVQNDRHQSLAEMNGFLAAIAGGEARSFDYRSLTGETLKGWVVLPYKYERGVRYPLVTYVYAGWTNKEPSNLIRINTDYSIPALNLQLLAARGYAVLMPSMPLPPTGREASDPYQELIKGVLPAVDKVIEMEIADPTRLAVMGQSFGGFSTYGLITQTDRFNAAIALAGITDMASLYGTFDATLRYGAYPHEDLFFKSTSEMGQFRMGAAPWIDPTRYLRNSPVFHVQDVKTPLLIVQGDMDFVAMQQGEEFFSALYRQGKRARFLRYWGEGHVLDSPANIRDFWTRAFQWLDECLNGKASNSPDTR